MEHPLQHLISSIVNDIWIVHIAHVLKEDVASLSLRCLAFSQSPSQGP